jgi:hypothetical protein
MPASCSGCALPGRVNGREVGLSTSCSFFAGLQRSAADALRLSNGLFMMTRNRV